MGLTGGRFLLVGGCFGGVFAFLSSVLSEGVQSESHSLFFQRIFAIVKMFTGKRSWMLLSVNIDPFHSVLRTAMARQSPSPLRSLAAGTTPAATAVARPLGMEFHGLKQMRTDPQFLFGTKFGLLGRRVHHSGR